MDLIYIILTVVLILIILIFIKYNKLIKLLNRVKRAKANIEIYSNKRFDLIPNLVECVKGYSKHESSTLEDIVALRNNYNKNEHLNLGQVSDMNNQLNKYLAIVENYPDLKANTQFMSLQSELKNVENELQRARHIYNDEVTRYNTAIEVVPSNIIASIFAFKHAELFQIEDNKKENVKVEL